MGGERKNFTYVRFSIMSFPNNQKVWNFIFYVFLVLLCIPFTPELIRPLRVDK